MDPALAELIGEGQPGEEVGVVVRLNPKAAPPPALRVVARFGEVVTARALRGDLQRLHGDPAIASIKAPRSYAREFDPDIDMLDEALDAETVPRPSDRRRPEGLAETGRGTIICVIDWYLDFAHPDLRNRDGSTRLLALWDQRGVNARPDKRYGYGTIHQRADIDRALGAKNPFAALGYRCTDRAHGTHVMGIAAGNGAAGGPEGVAPGADLLFVHLGSGNEDLGSSIELLEAIDFAVRMAEARPLVFNLSLGRHAGPHDGTLLIERAIDWLLVNRPGTAVVQSTGNYYSRNVHMAGRISETRIARLPFHLGRRDNVPVSVEVWYSGADEFAARMHGPGGAHAEAALDTSASVILADGGVAGQLYHRRKDPNNGANLVNLFLRPEAASGEWVIEIEGIDVVDGRWNAWIERNAACSACQGQFKPELASRMTTTGSICNALRTVAVGAYDASSPTHALPNFSSAGPTTDGRPKPLLCAPGVRVLSIRSRADPSTEPGYVQMSGTSMASPHVAGVLALMMQAAGPRRVASLRRALFSALDERPDDDLRWGYGLLDIEGAVKAARQLPADRKVPSESLAMLEPASAAAYAPALVAIAGRRPDTPIAAGDILWRSTPTGNRRLGAIVALDQDDGTRGLFVRLEGEPGYLSLLHAPPSAPIRVIAPDGLVTPGLIVGRGPGPAEAELASPAPARAILRQGSSGSAVMEAQDKLNRIHARRLASGLSPIAHCPLSVDGRFGANTRAAVVSFQTIAFPTTPKEWDGVVGPRSWAMLDLFAYQPEPVTPPFTPPNIPIIPVIATPLRPERWLPILSDRPDAPVFQLNAVKALVDGPETYRAMARDIEACQNERCFVYLLGWDIYDNFPLLAGDCNNTLGALLARADARGVQIRAMVWNNLFKPGAVNDEIARINALRHGGGIVDGRNGGATPITPQEVEAIMRIASGALSLVTLDPHAQRIWDEIRDEIARKLKGLLAAHHQKVLLCFDGERLVVYVGGLDCNPNRMPADRRDCGTGDRQAIQPSDPQHDSHCRIVGPATREVLRCFVDRWLDHPSGRPIDTAKGPLLGDPVSRIPAPPVPNPDPADAPFGGSCSVAIAQTFTPVAGPTRLRKLRDIKAMLLRAITRAQHFIYFEDQYLIDLELAAMLNRALPQLAHVTALIPGNRLSRGILFPEIYRKQFVDTVTHGHTPDIAAKFKLYQLNKPRGSPPNSFGPESYVHSKCWVFDDELAVIGSANCNRRGYQHDSEIDAFIFDDAIASPGTLIAARENAAEISVSGQTFAQQFRQRQWSEHLGVALADVEDGVASAALWPDFSSPLIPRPLLGVARFDHADPPLPRALRKAMELAADPLRNLVDPASP